jgi:hypothetical protein
MNVQTGSRVGGLTETASLDRAEFRTDRGHRPLSVRSLYQRTMRLFGGPLCVAGPKSALGQTRKSSWPTLTSALPLKADIRRADWHVRKVPEADITMGILVCAPRAIPMRLDPLSDGTLESRDGLLTFLTAGLTAIGQMQTFPLEFRGGGPSSRRRLRQL